MNYTNELLEILKVETQRMKREMAREKEEKLNKLKSGTKYYLTLTYIEEKNKKREVIPIEGYENGMKLLETYRKIGFNLRLRSIELTLKMEKVKKINFKYKWD